MIQEQHEDMIIKRVKESGISSKALEDDLIDHFCCLVEILMDKGNDFEQAYEKALKQTAPEGLETIERETIFLLNYNKIVIMKKLMFISGYLFTAIWLIGIFFKVMHLPGAGVLMAAGGLGTVFIFLPIYLINKFKAQTINLLSEKLKYVLGAASIMLLVISTTMKFLHLQGAAIMLAVAFLVLTFGFMPFLFFTLYKSSLEKL